MDTDWQGYPRGCARSRSLALVAACAFAVVTAGARPARADGDTFSWARGAGAEACPARARVVAELEAARRASLAVALAGRSLDVLLRRDGEAWEATLYWRAADGALLGSRTLAAQEPSCEAFTRAVIATVLVALATGVYEAPPAVAAREATLQPPEPLTAAPPASTTTAVAPPDPAPARAVAASSTPVASRAAPPAVASPRGDVARLGGLSLGGVSAWGWIPTWGYGVQLHGEPLLYGRLRVAVSATVLAESGLFGPPGVTATFGAVEFGVDACAMLFRVASRLETALCAGARAGAVQSFVYDGSAALRGTQGSFALQSSAVVQLFLAGPLFVAVDTAFRWNATRYVLPSPDGTTAVVTQAPVGVVLSLRVGVRFP